MAAARDTRKHPPVICDSGRVDVCGLHQEVVREIFAGINSRMSRVQVLWVVGTLCVIVAFYGVTLWGTCSGAIEAQDRQVQALDKELALSKSDSTSKILLLRAELDTIKVQLEKLDKGQQEMRREITVKLESIQSAIHKIEKG